jgi:anti-sigma factor ChrR (cupin superfamily)
MAMLLALALAVGAQSNSTSTTTTTTTKATHSTTKHTSDQGSHIALAPADMKWGDAPPFFTPGAKFAVLQGDPTKAGSYVIRLKVPDGYVVSPHWHPTAENVTVLSGTFNIGMGDALDKTKSAAFGAGSYVSIDAKMHHYAWFSGESEIQVHGVGPFIINYVNSTDDPRKAKK